MSTVLPGTSFALSYYIDILSLLMYNIDIECESEIMMKKEPTLWQFHCMSNDPCKFCLQYNGKIFEENDMPQIPLHPNCKCFYEMVIDSYEGELKEVTTSPSSMALQPSEHIDEPQLPQSLSYLTSINRAHEIMRESQNLSHISDAAIELLLKYETPYSKYLIKDNDGNILGIKPYNVGDGGITVGFGHFISYNTMAKDLNAYKLTQRNLSIDEAISLLKSDLEYFETQVLNLINENEIYLTQNEFDALVLQAYNYGNIKYLTDLLKSGSRDRDEWIQVITKRMEKNKGTNFYNGLMNRRYQEVDLFLYGDYNGGPDVKKYP